MSGMQWVKLHTDILGDDKLFGACAAGFREIELLPWMISFAARANDDGRLSVSGESASPQAIARLLPGVRSGRVATCLKSLEAIGILVRQADGVLAFTAWERRAGRVAESRDVMRERKRRSRARHADVTRVTLPVTQMSRAVEVEVEGEVEVEEELPPTPFVPDGTGNGSNGTGPHLVAPAEAPRPEPEPVAPAPPESPDAPRPRTARPRPDPKHPHFAKHDCDTLYEAWGKYIGVVEYSRFRKSFGLLFASATPRYTVAELVRAIEAAEFDTSGESPIARRLLTPETFVAAAAHWVPQSKIPLVDEWGLPTSRGRRMFA